MWRAAQIYHSTLYIYIYIFFLMVYIFSFSILYCLLAAESSHVWPFFSTFHLFSRWPRINPGGGLLFRVNQWLRNPLDQCGHQHRRSSAAAGVLRATTRASAADLLARHALGSVSAETPRKGPSFGLCGDWAMTKVHKNSLRTGIWPIDRMIYLSNMVILHSYGLYIYIC